MLKPRKRLSKKELKEDKLVTFYINANNWVKAHSSYIYTVLIALVLLVVGITYFTRASAKKNELASAELIQATQLYEAGDFEEAIPLFSSIVENYRGTQSAGIGKLYLAKCFYNTLDYSNAETYFREFLSDYKGNEHFGATAMGGIAACYEQQGRYLDAVEQYSKAADKYPESIHAPQFLLKAAMNARNAGEVERSKSLLEQLVQNYPDATEVTDAEMLMAMIEQQ
ncbi:tetratricopeptide repeat protein [candidate division KSB1 bacterium]|nr:tetratricopeptide repeat protein [candidate division KSB1 bacterium]